MKFGHQVTVEGKFLPRRRTTRRQWSGERRIIPLWCTSWWTSITRSGVSTIRSAAFSSLRECHHRARQLRLEVDGERFSDQLQDEIVAVVDDDPALAFISDLEQEADPGGKAALVW